MRASSTVSLVQVTGSNLTYAYIVLGISLAALAIAYGLRAQVLAASDGTPKMREIAEAIQEGAAAFLARQFHMVLCPFGQPSANPEFAHCVCRVSPDRPQRGNGYLLYSVRLT